MANLSPRIAAAQLLEQALSTGVRGNLREAIQRALKIASEGPAHQLTDLEYEAIKPGETLVDKSRPGFIARANRKGVRFMYRHNNPVTGQREEAHIGYLPQVTLAEARRVWERLRGARMQGEIPDQVADKAARALPTIAQLVDLYLGQYAEKVKRPRSEREDRRQLHKHVVPAYGHIHADEFGYSTVAAIMASLSSTPVEARKLRATLHTLFNVAVGKTSKVQFAETWLPRTFPNPVSTITLQKVTKEVRAPSESSIRNYARGLRSSETIRRDFRDLLLVQVLLASRIREVVEMQWSELDLDAGTWILPAARSKNHQSHTVFLPAEALSVLRERAGWKSAKEIYVFPSPSNRERPLRVDQVQHVLADSREALGVDEEFTSHKVRHAFTTWAAENGYSVDSVNRCTGHIVATGINAIYNGAKLNGPAKDLWSAWAEFLL